MDLLRESKIKSVLDNMVAITRSKADRDYITKVIKKAKEEGLIHDKEYFRLLREIENLRSTGDR